MAELPSSGTKRSVTPVGKAAESRAAAFAAMISVGSAYPGVDAVPSDAGLPKVAVYDLPGYASYVAAKSHLDRVREHIDPIPNLHTVGRNGMHKYNNQDHSMLTAMAAVDAIAAGSSEKSAIWNVNAEDDYHETLKK
jgi:hypothetical protein